MEDDNHFGLQLSYIICSKITSSISLIFNIFLLFKYCTNKTPDKTLIHYIQIELIIACMLASFGQLLPEIINGKVEPITFICHTQALLHYYISTVINYLFGSIPFITYIIVIKPTFIEKPIRALLQISIFCWSFPILIIIICEFFGTTQYVFFYCSYRAEYLPFIIFGADVFLFLLLFIIAIKLKRRIKILMIILKRLYTSLY